MQPSGEKRGGYAPRCSTAARLEDWQPQAVRVWLQKKATKDGIIAAWLSDLIVEEGDKFSMISTDANASEHSPELRLKKWLNNSVQHTIGMRKTAKTQVTEVRFAKLAKDGANLMMATRRRLHRLFPMNSQHVDLMYIVTAMQYACKKNNTNENGVLKAFRIGGWFAYKPTPNGLVRAIGGQLSKYPLGSSRLSSKVIDQRFHWVDKDGIPCSLLSSDSAYYITQ